MHCHSISVNEIHGLIEVHCTIVLAHWKCFMYVCMYVIDFVCV